MQQSKNKDEGKDIKHLEGENTEKIMKMNDGELRTHQLLTAVICVWSQPKMKLFCLFK